MELHRQLKQLWNQKPLLAIRTAEDAVIGCMYSHLLADLAKPVGLFTFSPLICNLLSLVCEIEILMLRPEEPGNLIATGGDIDNRLKTLFDALRYPKNASEIPPDATPDADTTPFHCLLEDDNLITSVAVTTDRLLRPVGANDVELILTVRSRPTVTTAGNLALL